MAEFKPKAPTNKTENIQPSGLSVENINTRINNLEGRAGRDPKATQILEDYKKAHNQVIMAMLKRIEPTTEKAPAQATAGESSVFDNDSGANKLAAAEKRSAEKQQPRL